MIERSAFTIDKNKSEEFKEFISKNAKGKDFWNDVQKAASKSVDKKALDTLFKEDK
ncbi:MAG: hypothetical protein IJ109_05625 [Firmicutes bacterium]|nr:hypothetical protein [Bacillota bacterium]